MKIHTNFSRSINPDVYVPDPSAVPLVVPRQSMTVPEILNRFASGGTFMNALGVRYEVRDDLNLTDDEIVDVYGREFDPDEQFSSYDQLNQFYTGVQTKEREDARKKKKEKTSKEPLSDPETT